MVILAAMCIACAGCQRTIVEHSATDDFPDAQSELDYFDALEEQAVITNNDMLHSFFLVADGEDDFRAYQWRLKEAKRRGWLPEGFDESGTESAQVGWVASIACRVTDFDGGISYLLFGPIPRYATRELANAQILVGKRELQSLSGREFVDFLTRLVRITQFGKPALLDELSAVKGASGTGRKSNSEAAQPVQPPAARFE